MFCGCSIINYYRRPHKYLEMEKKNSYRGKLWTDDEMFASLSPATRELVPLNPTGDGLATMI